MACLDTSVLVDLLQGHGRSGAARAAETIRAIRHAGEPVVTTRFNVAEVYVGVERASDRTSEEARVLTVLAGVPVLEFDAQAANAFARFTAHLQRIGRPAGDMDVLIASVAVSNGHAIVTRNVRHFADIPGLDVRAY